MYTTLNAHDMQLIRMKRINWLESEHARFCLILEEAPNDDEAIRMTHEIERRLRVHYTILESMPTPPDKEPEKESP